ncbi:16S rRNA (adenine(1518)-N(6)/adenine(1519)-N(6))-dimethyltransferase RsmA [Spiroplasma culicicola]|uniref:Ribosomal RNA small subunit methyltransferase A n=1 Tax=Spiroplasma culicicola AES-1 TaxID=1276246 RepID=W6A8A9_9MOLU|nr:16S rRNA (adenine(1518)-N(6)/adenine(1519)-N(6))-dimethyltransferase RsmA [Spiroplasma culicicola]AHI53398.1 dimethyladenosine transferase [Spiroplasma culicicola AES-1]
MEFAKKKFGQNFISDKNLINKIINILDQDEKHLIIEIGPGRGALTKELVKRFEKVIAIEIDKDMEYVLKFEITEPNFELIIDDVLNIDFEQFLKLGYKKISLISNTPYYITSQIIFRTLNFSTNLDAAIFMVQKEVATRICAKQNENNYNNLSIACQFYSELKYEFTVNKNMFRPVPKVDSAIISLKFNNKYLNSVNDDQKFVEMVRKLFNNKRKTILNNLGQLTANKSQSQLALEKLKINPMKRPENLSIEDFISIYNEVAQWK